MKWQIKRLNIRPNIWENSLELFRIILQHIFLKEWEYWAKTS
jgi:hypothetical protein